MAWSADFSESLGGFTICGSDAMVAVPPKPPPPAPLPPPPVLSPSEPAATPYSSMWEIVAGAEHCQITNLGTCVTDGVGNHANLEDCTIRTTQSLYATSTYFNVETFFDYVTIGGTQYSGSSGPMNVMMTSGATLRWQSDSSMAAGGWTICGSAQPTTIDPPAPSPPPPVLSPAPPAGANDFFAVLSGSAHCQVSANGGCVTEGAGQHGNSENCVMRAQRLMYAHATEFNTEDSYDYITMGTTQYSGTQGPQNVLMMPGDTFEWSSDGSLTRDGWTICGYTTAQALPPSASPLPPPSPTPPPPAYAPAPPANGAMWAIVDGSSYCSVTSNGLCVTDGTGDHGNSERCLITATQSLYATAIDFSVEADCAHAGA